jgi:hypothetical protein
MMQTTDDGQLDHFAHLWPLDLTPGGRVLAQRQVRPARMIVVVEIAAQETGEVLFAHNDHLVEQLPPQCADDALDVWSLPCRSSGDQLSWLPAWSAIMLQFGTRGEGHQGRVRRRLCHRNTRPKARLTCRALADQSPDADVRH